MKTPPLIAFLLLLMVSNSLAGRSIYHEPTNLIKNHTYIFFSSPSLSNLGSTSVTCDTYYGFLPCTTEFWGQLFLVVVYEYMLSLAQKYVTSGSDLFFKMFGSGILGASVFPILGTIPQVVILLVNGITGSTSTAESLTTQGLAMLAGSTVLSLTLVWGSIVAFGSYDFSKAAKTTLVDSQASTPLLTEETSSTSPTSTAKTKSRFSLTGFGVTTDEDTTWTARIMLLSMIPFIILQLPKILDSSSATRIIILITLLITITFWVTYCIYQVFQPWIQNRRLDYILMKFVRDSLLECLLDPQGDPNESNIQRLFGELDKDKSGTITKTELESLFYGIHIKEVGLDAGDYVKRILEQFDISQDDSINEVEFVKGMKSWLQEANNPTSTSNVQHNKSTSTKTDKSWLNYTKAVSLVVIGTAISILLAEPLMENISDIASAISIPSFLITYIVVPLATALRPAIKSIKSARKKTENAISLTLSATYGGVFMNGMMNLTMFLLLSYVRELTWDVSAGILTVLIVGLIMGFLTSFITKIPFWLSIFAILLYPISIGFIYVLITYGGWS